MPFSPDPRVAEAKAIPVQEVLHRLGVGGLRRAGGEMIGPCPLCGGRDRFGVNLRTSAFLCRKCDIRGGDQLALVQALRGCDFRAALAWLAGDEEGAVDPREVERRRRRAEAAERARRAQAERFRARAIEAARRIWRAAMPGEGSLAQAYLETRGISAERLPAWPKALRFLPEHQYAKRIGVDLVTPHLGPCMVAAIQGRDDRLSAVHQTWIAPEPPHGKARILHDDESLPAKLVRGSKKGGAIRLHTPRQCDTLVMGEGIETTLSALVADAVPGAAYWAGVDLGNMAGRMQRIQGKRHSGVPDMSDGDAFVPPPWVRRLVFIQDGDSDPVATRAKLEAGLRRAMALIPGLRGQIVHAGDGVDLNDVLIGAEVEND